MNVGFYRADLAGRGFITQGKQGLVFPSIYLYHLDRYVGNTQITSIGDLCCDAGRAFAFSSYTCNNRRFKLWDYVEPGEALCYFLSIVSPTGCLVLLLSFYFFIFSFSYSVSFPDVIKTCYSTSACQTLRKQIYTNNRHAKWQLIKAILWRDIGVVGKISYCVFWPLYSSLHGNVRRS